MSFKGGRRGQDNFWEMGATGRDNLRGGFFDIIANLYNIEMDGWIRN